MEGGGRMRSRKQPKKPKPFDWRNEIQLAMAGVWLQLDEGLTEQSTISGAGLLVAMTGIALIKSGHNLMALDLGHREEDND
jgi:hypothetical protein